MPLTVEQSRCLVYELERGERGLLVCRCRLPGKTYAGASTLQHKARLQKLLNHDWVDAVDRRILMQLYMASSRDKDEVELTGKGGATVLREMVRTGRCVWIANATKGSKGATQAQESLVWSEEPCSGELGWELVSGGKQRPVLKVRSEPGAEEAEREGRESWTIAATQPPAAVQASTGEVAFLQCQWPDAVVSKWLQGGDLDENTATAFLEEMQARCPAGTEPLPIPALVQKRVRTDIRPKPRLALSRRVFYPRALGETVELYVGELSFDYAGSVFSLGDRREEDRQVDEQELVVVRRNRDLEAECIARLTHLGLARLQEEFRGYHLEDAFEGFVGPKGDPAIWYDFLTQGQKELEAEGWQITFEGRHLALAEDVVEYCEVEPTEKPGWFDFEAGVVVDGKRVNLLPLIHDLLKRYQGKSAEEIRRLMASQVYFVQTVSGETHLFRGERLHEFVERIFELYDRDPFHMGERVRLNALRTAELAETYGYEGAVPGISPAVRKLAGILQEGVTIEPAENPAGLQATLRDYQKIGVGWLQFLAEHEVNGVLADEMGLGKTLQTIAHLVAEKQAGRLERPALLVAPTSLTENWKNEVERFAPQLRVMMLQGTRRAIQFRAMDSADIVITTYGMVRSDAKRHLEQFYSWIILDEAQFIKNTRSKVTEVLCALKSDRRLCLTGTPMENHLGELWSLFHFLMPGFLGEKDTFKQQFRVPIEQDGNAVKRDVLMRRVRPFLLRRKKIEVVSELPPKTEIHRTIEMASRQRDIYESVRLAMHKKVQREISERGLARSQIIILDAIMKLRQICCDPRLAKLEEEGLELQHSAKLAELTQVLPDMIQDGHRILVFSQFTSMFKLMEPELRRIGLDFVTLTGSTRNRAACVDAFQSGKVPLFLISLRAGGTGLNLTEADTVIHYDPWWNPAVESQATDRAHRIGQQRPVLVYKMIAENSVEEKIVAMQQKKAALAEGILSGSGSTQLHFDEEDVSELLG